MASMGSQLGCDKAIQGLRRLRLEVNGNSNVGLEKIRYKFWTDMNIRGGMAPYVLRGVSAWKTSYV